MDFIVEDYLETARSRYGEQFKDDLVFDAIIKTILTVLQQQQESIGILGTITDIDSSVGAQLDVIGRIVGQPRLLVFFNSDPYFGFQGSENGQPFGTITDPSIGGIFRSKNSSGYSESFSLDDASYRRIIKTRILANNSRATPEDTLACLNSLTETTSSVIIERPDNAGVTFNVPNTVDAISKYFLRSLDSRRSLVPVPIGVRVTVNYV